MKNSQKTKLLYSLHFVPNFKRAEFAEKYLEKNCKELTNKPQYIKSILEEFNNSIGVLNAKQFEILIQLVTTAFNENSIGRKLDIYNVKPEYFESIIKFCSDYHQINKTRKKSGIFLQNEEISIHNFKALIKQGWVGDWEDNPDDGNLKMIKIPALIENGKKNCYFLAKVIKTIPIKYKDRIKYRVYFFNPRIVIS